MLRQDRSSEKEIQYILEIITCDPSIYTMDHPDFIACSFMENSIGLKLFNRDQNQYKIVVTYVQKLILKANIKTSVKGLEYVMLYNNRINALIQAFKH